MEQIDLAELVAALGMTEADSKLFRGELRRQGIPDALTQQQAATIMAHVALYGASLSTVWPLIWKLKR